MKKITIRPLELSLFLYAGSLFITSIRTLGRVIYDNFPILGRLILDSEEYASYLELLLLVASAVTMLLYFKKTKEKFALVFPIAIFCNIGSFFISLAQNPGPF